MLEAVRNPVDDLLAHSAEREDQKQQAGKKNDSQRRLPRHAAAKNDRISEVRVEQHPRGKRNRVVCPQAHDDRGDRRRNASGEENAIDRHAPFPENLRVDDHNIRHGHERGQPREQFAPHRGLVFLKVKDALKQPEFSGIKGAPIGRERRVVNGRTARMNIYARISLTKLA